MNKNRERRSVIVDLAAGGPPKFTFGSLRQVTREQRMDRIVTSVSNKFSRELAAIIQTDDNAAHAPRKKVVTKKATKK
tara:strand:- start:2852 stop:3085 length:234 start_codon:yes stop_codon:yes gene_type:complete